MATNSAILYDPAFRNVNGPNAYNSSSRASKAGLNLSLFVFGGVWALSYKYINKVPFFANHKYSQPLTLIASLGVARLAFGIIHRPAASF